MWKNTWGNTCNINDRGLLYEGIYLNKCSVAEHIHKVQSWLLSFLPAVFYSFHFIITDNDFILWGAVNRRLLQSPIQWICHRKLVPQHSPWNLSRAEGGHGWEEGQGIVIDAGWLFTISPAIKLGSILGTSSRVISPDSSWLWPSGPCDECVLEAACPYSPLAFGFGVVMLLVLFGWTRLAPLPGPTGQRHQWGLPVVTWWGGFPSAAFHSQKLEIKHLLSAMVQCFGYTGGLAGAKWKESGHLTLPHRAGELISCCYLE
jgi:hypothetical protein